MSKVLKIALVAGEASGDILGSDLIYALRQINSNIEFMGVGGNLMSEAGLNSIFPMERLSVMGLSEVIGRIPELLWRRYKLAQTLIKVQPNIFIGIDAPDFNLDLELKLRKNGIKTVHYVSPSVWAWRQSRIIKIKKSCDLMLTLLPFEADFYHQFDVPVKFVGHPLADKITPIASAQAKKELGFNCQQIVIALMPGSRAGELTKLGRLFLESANLLQQDNSSLVFVIPCANYERFQQMQTYATKYPQLSLKIMLGNSDVALSACDLVILASGTATLEAMLYHKPMVVAYKLSSVTFWLLKKMVQTKFVALPNLLANTQVVPELLQDEANAYNIWHKSQDVLANSHLQTEHFIRLASKLKQNSSMKAAKTILNLC